MSEMRTTPVRTINASGLRDIGSDGHNERNHNILEHENPRLAIPLQTATTAALLFQLVEISVPLLGHRHQVLDQEQEIAGQSDGFVYIGPRLHVYCRVEECAGEKEDEGVDGDQHDDAQYLDLFGGAAEVCCVREERDAAD